MFLSVKMGMHLTFVRGVARIKQDNDVTFPVVPGS